MLVALTFLYPAVLAAAGAVLVPVLIHLLLRERPKPVVFPALRFVRKSHRVSISRLRLRQLVLLAMRMLAVALVALLLARPAVPNWRHSLAAGQPAAMAVVIDNSVSMDYFKGQGTCLSRGKQEAARIVAALPSASLVTVLESGNAHSAVPLLTDTQQGLQQISKVSQSGGAQALGPALAKALATVRQSDLPRKEVLVVTDLARHALVGVLPDAGDDVTVTVLDVSPGEIANATLGPPGLSARALPLGATLRVDVPVTRAGGGGELPLAAQVDDMLQRETLALTDVDSGSVSFAITPSKNGPCHGAVRLGLDDALSADNTRYFSANVAPRPRVLLVRDAHAQQDQTSFLIGSAIAPGGTDSPATRRTITAQRLSDGELATCDILLLANVSALGNEQWSLIERFVRQGGCLWVVAGPGVSVDSYALPAARAVLPASLASPQRLNAAMTFDESKLDNALLAPFAAPGNPPLAQSAVWWRLAEVVLAEDAHALLAYRDGVPAVAVRSVGLGKSLLWNLSPAPDCSNLASRPQGVILAMRSVTLLAGEPLAQTDWPLGQRAVLPLPPRMRAPSVSVAAPGASTSQALLPDLPSRSVAVECDRIGHWTVLFREGANEQRLGFSVNLPLSESDLAPADRTQVLAAMGTSTAIVASASEFSQHQVRVAHGLDLAAPVLLVLLALLIGESFFANRFYARP